MKTKQKNPYRTDRNSHLFEEIEKLGLSEKDVVQSLDATAHSVAQTVANNPEAYEVTSADREGQQVVLEKEMERISQKFLAEKVAELRKQAGYISIWGQWIHRSLITLISYSALALAGIPFFFVQVFSSRAWGWLYGLLGLVVLSSIGGFIFWKTKTKIN